MRFRVPQFIEIEAKLFGPFTWRQAVYLGGGVGLGIILLWRAPFWVFLFFGLPLMILGLLLAFYPVNNQPFSVFLEGMFDFLRRPKQYTWQKTATSVYGEEATITEHAFSSPNQEPNLQKLSRRLEMEAVNNENHDR